MLKGQVALHQHTPALQGQGDNTTMPFVCSALEYLVSGGFIFFVMIVYCFDIVSWSVVCVDDVCCMLVEWSDACHQIHFICMSVSHFNNIGMKYWQNNDILKPLFV